MDKQDPLIEDYLSGVQDLLNHPPSDEFERWVWSTKIYNAFSKAIERWKEIKDAEDTIPAAAPDVDK